MAEKVVMMWAYLCDELAAPGSPTGTTYTLRVYTASSGAGGSGWEELTFDGGAAALEPGRFYWASGDGQTDADNFGGRGDLVKALEACLNRNSHSVTFTVGREVGGRVVIALTGGTAQIAWNHANTSLRADVFGFDQSATTPASPASTFNSPNVAGGQFMPGKGFRSYVPGELAIGGISDSPDGSWRAGEHADPIGTLDISFGLLERARGPINYAATSEPLNTAGHLWRALRRGRPVRIFRDHTSVDASSYSLWRLRPEGQNAQPVIPDNRNRIKWQVTTLGLIEVRA